jgi:hypothetical protein
VGYPGDSSGWFGFLCRCRHGLPYKLLPDCNFHVPTKGIIPQIGVYQKRLVGDGLCQLIYFRVGGFKHLFSISYMGCHPSHWLTFFRGVGQPPTSF